MIPSHVAMKSLPVKFMAFSSPARTADPLDDIAGAERMELKRGFCSDDSYAANVDEASCMLKSTWYAKEVGQSTKRANKSRWIGAGLVAAVVTSLALGWPSAESKPLTCSTPSIRIFKREAVLELWCNGTLNTTMDATFGASPVGQKEREGDERTPEGTYRINSKVESARFHRFLGVNYPNDEDLKRTKRLGITNPGGGIGIHGTTRKLAPLARAWIRVGRATGLSGIIGPTDGCIGVSNEDVERLYATIPVGTPVIIAPKRPEKKE
jgi:hypothetical protein